MPELSEWLFTRKDKLSLELILFACLILAVAVFNLTSSCVETHTPIVRGLHFTSNLLTSLLLLLFLNVGSMSEELTFRSACDMSLVQDLTLYYDRAESLLCSVYCPCTDELPAIDTLTKKGKK